MGGMMKLTEWLLWQLNPGSIQKGSWKTEVSWVISLLPCWLEETAGRHGSVMKESFNMAVPRGYLQHVSVAPTSTPPWTATGDKESMLGAKALCGLKRSFR